MIDAVFKALSDQNRREILNLLKKGDMPVKEINTHFNITMASLSHHLDIFAGLRAVTTLPWQVYRTGLPHKR